MLIAFPTVQDLLDELEGLLVSLAHLVARMLGSCKRSKRNQLIPSKLPQFFQYVTWAWVMFKRIKYNVHMN